MDATHINAVEALARAAAELKFVGATPIAVVPAGYKVEDLEKLMQTPTRKRGSVAMRDVASFCAMVNLHKNDGTAIYGTYNPPAFKAVFNDHDANVPNWRDHTAGYSCPLSVEWATWMKANKQQMSQADFAQFIEDNAPDIVSPDPATMIEIARTLEAKKKVNFAQGIRLSNGETQFTYEEETQGTAGKGRFQVPETFTIAIQVFEGIGVPKNQIGARLRYRISAEGGLTLWYDLDRPHKDLEAAALDVWKQIEANTGLTIFNGA